ncbi:hypothetical protein MASR1M74_09380 [Lentimicrobium sp.]
MFLARSAYDEYATLDIDALKEAIKDYKSDFEGKIFIGKRAGFMDEKNNALAELADELSELIELKTVNEAIDTYCEQINNQLD